MIGGDIKLAHHILSHFSSLFTTSSDISSFSEILSTHLLSITALEGTLLSKPPTQTEIIDSIKSFKPLKAPRPDGMHPFFLSKVHHQFITFDH